MSEEMKRKQAHEETKRSLKQCNQADTTQNALNLSNHHLMFDFAF